MRDVYLVIGDRQEDGGWAVRSYIEPFVNCHLDRQLPDGHRRRASA